MTCVSAGTGRPMRTRASSVPLDRVSTGTSAHRASIDTVKGSVAGLRSTCRIRSVPQKRNRDPSAAGGRRPAGERTLRPG